MFNTVRHFFGMITVVEKNNIISINGIPANTLKYAIEKIYETRKINKYLFLPSGRHELKFYSFFAVEVECMLLQLEEKIKTYKVKRIVHKCIEEMRKHTWLSNIYRDNHPNMVDLSYLSVSSWTPKPHQIAFLKQYGEEVPKYNLRGYLLAAPPGLGKSLSLEALIKIPGGWMRMGDVTLGQIVIAPDGTQTRIIGVYPQGLLDAYTITFSDGRSTVCSRDHLWSVVDMDALELGEEVLTLDQLITDIRHARLAIRCVTHPVIEDISLPFSPTDLASWIHDDKLSSIPDLYQEMSLSQKLSFISALLGKQITLDHRTFEEYVLVEHQVALDVQKMIRSMGAWCDIYEDQGYHLQISFDVPYLKILSITKNEKPEQMQCISVDHPDCLYITDDFIVTHNTAMDLFLAAAVIPREIAEVKIIISPRNAIQLVWEDTLRHFFKKMPKYWISAASGPCPLDVEYAVFHYEALDRAVEFGKALKDKGIKYFVVIDESHNFNTLGSKRTDNLVELCRLNDAYSVWASGSPIKALGTEIIPMLRAIAPNFTPEVEQVFKKVFGGDVEGANEILYNRIGRIAYKIAKTEVIKEKAIPIKIRVKLPHAQKYLISTVRQEMKEYIETRLLDIRKDMDQYKKTFEDCLIQHKATLKTSQQNALFKKYLDAVNELRRNQRRPDPNLLNFTKNYEQKILLPSLPVVKQREFKQVRSLIKSLLLKVRGEALGRILSKRRAECSAALATHCNLEELVANGIAKSLVFSNYTHSLITADKYLRDKGFKTGNVYGDTSKDVTKIVNQFKDDLEMNPIMATYASLSTAVPVTVANQIIMLDLPFRHYIWDQTVSRALRLGQLNQVFVYEITLDTGSEGNVSTRSDEIVSWSRDQVSSLLGEDFGGPTQDEYQIDYIDTVEMVNTINGKV